MAEAMRLRAAGEDVVDFSAGQPDFDTPSVARDAGIRAIESGYTRYTPNPGAPDLRAAVADCYRRDFDLDFAAGNVLITSGGKHALTGSPARHLRRRGRSRHPHALLADVPRAGEDRRGGLRSSPAPGKTPGSGPRGPSSRRG